MHIGKWQLNDSATLSSGREIHQLTPKAYDLLVYLTERPGKLVTNNELVEVLWSHQFVSDTSIYKLISELRRALGDDPRAPTYIRTVSRLGYMLVAEVTGTPYQRVEANRRKPDNEEPTKTGAFNRASGISAVTIVALAGLLWWNFGASHVSNAADAPRAEPVLMVLPFRNLSASDADRNVALGIYDDELVKISNLPGLKVIGRITAMRFQNSAEDPIHIAAEVGASHILTGSVRHAADKVHIDVELISVRDQMLLWSESLDRPNSDLGDLQNQIAAKVATALDIKIPDTKETKKATDRQAFNLFVEARELLNSPTPNDLRALQLLRQAVKLNPNLGIAYRYIWFAISDLGEDRLYTEGSKAAQRAYKLDGGCLREIASYPNDSRLRLFCGNVFASDGRMGAARDQFERAMQLEPLSPYTHLAMARLPLPGNEGLKHLKRALELAPKSASVAAKAGAQYQRYGMNVKAFRLWIKAYELNPESESHISQIAGTLTQLRDYRDAEAWVNKLSKDSFHRYAVEIYLMARKGDWESAYKTTKAWIKSYPNFFWARTQLAMLTAQVAAQANQQGRHAESEQQRRRAVQMLETSLARFYVNGHWHWSSQDEWELSALMTLDYSLGEMGKAEAIARDNLAVDPPSFQFHRGLAYAVLGQDDNAVAAFETLVKEPHDYLSGTTFRDYGLTDDNPYGLFKSLRNNPGLKRAIEGIHQREDATLQELKREFPQYLLK